MNCIPRETRVKLEVKGYTGNTRYLSLSPEQAERKWISHYTEHLKRLFDIFQTVSNDRKLKISHITFEDFCTYCYHNSTKYLSPWI